MVESRAFLRGVAAGLLGLASISAACGGDETKPAATAGAESNVATATAPASPAAPTAVASGASRVASAASTVTPAATTVPATSGATIAPATPASTAAPQPTSPPRASAVSLTFRAFNTQFDKTSVHVPAGASVTATLQNDDAGVQHNLTFSLPGLPHGDTCTGPCTAPQTFTASAAGSYFFLCTIHDMVGTFVVDP